MVSIRYFAPAPALRRHISSYYWFQSFGPCFADLMRAELPQVRFVLRGRALNHYGNGLVRTSGTAHLQGATNGPVRFTASEPLHVFGAGLLPLGWAALIGEAADSLSDDMIELAGICGPAADRTYAELALATQDCDRVAAADRFFGQLLAVAHSAPNWFIQLADDWLTASPAPSVDALVTASGMSARSVERLTGRIYGASPKLLARKYRALGAAVRLGNGEASGWSDMTDDGLFYDQAHLIREFNQFIGMTPARFLAEAAPVTRLTIARKRLMPDLPKLALFS
jgi:AraC-like DNA-binding protein